MARWKCAFLTNKKKMFFYDEKSRAFVSRHTGKKLRGLHAFLEGRFYPLGSSYKTAIRGRKTAKKGSGLNKRQAKNFGKLVDSQIKRLVEAARGDAKTLRAWIAHKATTAPARMRTMTTQYKKPRMRLSPYVASGLDLLMKKGWLPVASQVPVGHEDANIATAVDLVCVNMDDKRKAVVEVKAGYDTYWQKHSKRNLCNLPSTCKLRDSAQNKAHLQALCSTLLYKQTFPLEPMIPDAYVLRLTRAGPELEPLLKCLQGAALSVWQTLTKKIA
jgi:hypothetical protein